MGGLGGGGVSHDVISYYCFFCFWVSLAPIEDWRGGGSRGCGCGEMGKEEG